MMTIQQAAIVVGRQIGLPADFDGSTTAINNLDPDTQLQFTAALGAYIRANQDQFTAAQVTTANTMPQSYGALTDSSFSVQDFLAETVSNADTLVAKPLVTLGESVSAAATAAASIGPALLLIAGAFILYSWTKTTAAK